MIAILGLASLVWALILFRRSQNREVFDRWTVAALPPLGLLLLLEIISGVVRAPTLLWNEVRMCRSLALIRGFSLYPPNNALGPVIGTLHAPLSHYFYLLAVGFTTPTSLILAGSALSVLVVVISIAWTLIRVARLPEEELTGTLLAFLFCVFLILQTPGTYNTVFMIHTDAPALACATIACGILCRRNARLKPVQIWIAGIACVLAIGCKQTLAPLSLGIVVFIAVVGGWQDIRRFLTAILVTSVVVLTAIAASTPMTAFLFNTIGLAAHRPWKPGYLAILTESFRAGKLEALPALFPIGALLVHSFISNGGRIRFKQIASQNRWLVFVFAGISLIPVCAKAIMTVGADVNHLGLVLYFLFVGAAIGIQQNLQASAEFRRLSARVFACLGIAVSLAPGAILQIPTSLHNLVGNGSEVAYQYVVHHGTATYFPLNPAAALLAGGNLYHFDIALFDREIGGAPLTLEQVQSGLPVGFERVALPPGERLASAALERLVSGWIQTSDPDLPGWSVLKRE